MMIFNKVRHLKKLQRQVKYFYQTMSPTDYLHNQREGNMVSKIQEAQLKPLFGCNHGAEGTGDEINLIGVPLGKITEKYEEYDTISSIVERIHPDMIFLQFNPMPFMARQRFLSHKCALKGVEDYDKTGISQIDPIVPVTWEECIVNNTVLDMLQKNDVHTNFDFTDGFTTYSYPYIQDKNITKSLKQPFVNSITENIVYNQFSDYFLINKALYTGVMGKHKVMLGDMPENLLRLILGNHVNIEEMRDLFKFVLTSMKNLKEPISIKEASVNFLPHIFQMPKDLYMTALLKESFQAALQIVAFIGAHHINPIQRYWEGPPNGINWTEATKIPERIRGESDEQLIEKQAIMDVMMGTKIWGQSFISNPFPYIQEDVTKIAEKDFNGMKQCFFDNYKKYESFKNKSVQQLPNYNENVKEKLLLQFQKQIKIINSIQQN